MIRHHLRQIFTKIFTVACLAAAAQETPHIRHFAPTDYQAQNQNWSIAQSPEGWIFAGNNECLLEFDGAAWRKFPTPTNGQTVRAVAIGRHGEIFAGGFGAFGFWKKEKNGRPDWQNLSQNVEAKNLAKEEIWQILPHGEAVYFQSFSTIYKFDYQRVTVIEPPSAIMFLQAVGSRLIFQKIGGGLYELLPDDSQRLLPQTEVLADKIVQFIVPDGSAAGGFFVGTSNHGIYHFQNERLAEWQNPLNETFKKTQLNRALQLADGAGWVFGTILDGIYILDKNQQLAGHFNRQSGLQNNTVLALAEDCDRNLWVGLDRGIDFVELSAPLRFYRDIEGKTGATYTAALVTPTSGSGLQGVPRSGGRGYIEQLFIGANQGVFAKNYTPPITNHQSTNHQFQLVEGTQGQVWQLKNVAGKLFCGHNDGSFLIENQAFAKKISNQTGGWQLLEIPNSEEKWVQATYTGLAIFRKNPQTAAPEFWKKVDGFAEPLRSIAFDAAGNLWATHPNRGLFRLRLDAAAGQITEMKKFAEGTTDRRLTLVKLADERLFLNSPDGIFQLKTGGDGQPKIERAADFASEKFLLAGWGSEFFTGDGAGLKFFTSPPDPLSSGEGEAGSVSPSPPERGSGGEVKFPIQLVRGFENVVALDSNRYLFCLENGYALLDRRQFFAEKNAEKKPPLPPVIRQIWVNGLPHEAAADGSPLEFSADANSPIFHFAEASFGQPPQFAWRLDGSADGAGEWSPPQVVASKEFSNLPSGEYVFRLRSGQTGLETSLAFRIAPPWYRSGAAFFAYFLAVLAGFFFLEKYNLRRLARQRATLEREREAQLSHQRTENEREKLTLEVENKSRELSNAALSLVRKNEMLQKIKQDLAAAKDNPTAVGKIAREIDRHLEGDHDWEIFEQAFNAVHDDFFKRLMHEFPELTAGDLRLCAYLKMNLSSKEIAPLLNISVRGVENKRYRLRRKLGLSEEANLAEFVIGF